MLSREEAQTGWQTDGEKLAGNKMGRTKSVLIQILCVCGGRQWGNKWVEKRTTEHNMVADLRWAEI